MDIHISALQTSHGLSVTHSWRIHESANPVNTGSGDRMGDKPLPPAILIYYQ